MNGGNAFATVVAAPAGSFLGAIVGWRWAFFCTVPVAAIALVWKWRSLPRMPVEQRTTSATPFALFELLERRIVRRGIVAVSLLFMGQFALFTYLRPFLESVTHVSGSHLSLFSSSLGSPVSSARC